MSENTGTSQSHNKKDDKLPVEQQPISPASDEGADELIANPEPENPAEIPDWLLELEHKPMVIPFETVPQETYQDRIQPGQETVPDGAAGEPPQDDLPDWLKMDRKAPVRVEQQAPPEDEIPDWLRRGLEELQPAEKGPEASGELPGQPRDDDRPEGIAIPPVFDQTTGGAAWPESVERKRGESHPLPDWLVDPEQPEEAPARDEEAAQLDPSDLDRSESEIEEAPEASSAAPTAAPDLEVLAGVRQMLKEDEQAEPPQKRPGLLERMAGPILASKLIRPEQAEQDQEDQAGGPETQSAATAGEQPADHPEFPAELLARPLEEPEDVAFHTGPIASQPEDFSFLDEMGDKEDLSILFAESGAEQIEASRPDDQELRREILSDIETSESEQPSPPIETEKEKRPSLRSRFGFKKADDVEEPVISDEDLDRRLLITLTGAGMAGAATPLTDEGAESLERAPAPIQEEEADFQYLTDYEEEEAYGSLEEEASTLELGESADLWPEDSPLYGLDQPELIEEEIAEE